MGEQRNGVMRGCRNGVVEYWRNGVLEYWSDGEGNYAFKGKIGRTGDRCYKTWGIRVILLRPPEPNTPSFHYSLALCADRREDHVVAG
jgi:hypothetical protein